MIEELVRELASNKISKDVFLKKLQKCEELEDIDVYDIENLKLLGLPIFEKSNKLYLKTAFTKFKDERFCIVDIETNGSKRDEHQIIEIGAVMIKNGKEIDRFETFVRSDFLPEAIENLTGIKMDNLSDAPPLGFVLERFRLFLGDAVFVAHNVNFDYKFISTSLQKLGFGPLLNRKLCSIELSKKIFNLPKYGLGSMIEHFDISFGEHHRALNDAKSASYIFNEALKLIPKEIKTTEDLISFSMPIRKRKNRKIKE